MAGTSWGLVGHLSIYGPSIWLVWTSSQHHSLHLVELFIWWLSSKEEEKKLPVVIKAKFGTGTLYFHIIGQSQHRVKGKEIDYSFWCEEQHVYIGKDSSCLSKRDDLKQSQ